MITIALLVGTAFAWTFDMQNTSSTGCDPQWEGDCLSNNVWGNPSEKLFSIATSCSIGNTLYIRPGSQGSAQIGLGRFIIGGDSYIFTTLSGAVSSTGTVARFNIKYFDSANTLIGSGTQVVHSGAAGPFSNAVIFGSIPSGAVEYTVRLSVEGEGNLAISNAQVDSSEDIEDFEDFEACEIQCQRDDGTWYTLYGFEEGGLCSAECPPQECDPEKWPDVVMEC